MCYVTSVLTHSAKIRVGSCLVMDAHVKRGGILPVMCFRLFCIRDRRYLAYIVLSEERGGGGGERILQPPEQGEKKENVPISIPCFSLSPLIIHPNQSLTPLPPFQIKRRRIVLQTFTLKPHTHLQQQPEKYNPLHSQ